MRPNLSRRSESCQIRRDSYRSILSPQTRQLGAGGRLHRRRGWQPHLQALGISESGSGLIRPPLMSLYSYINKRINGQQILVVVWCGWGSRGSMKRKYKYIYIYICARSSKAADFELQRESCLQQCVSLRYIFKEGTLKVSLEKEVLRPPRRSVCCIPGLQRHDKKFSFFSSTSQIRAKNTILELCWCCCLSHWVIQRINISRL